MNYVSSIEPDTKKIPETVKQIMRKELSQLEEIEKLVLKLEEETASEPWADNNFEYYLGEYQAKRKLAKILRDIISRLK